MRNVTEDKEWTLSRAQGPQMNSSEFGLQPGQENLILFPLKREGARDRKAAVRCRERLGGLLKYYEREAA
jgi:hypothetical protein